MKVSTNKDFEAKKSEKDLEKSPEFTKRTDLGINSNKSPDYKQEVLRNGPKKGYFSKKEEKMEDFHKNKANNGNFVIKHFMDNNEENQALSPGKLQLNNSYLLQLEIEDKEEKKKKILRKTNNSIPIEILEEESSESERNGKKKGRKRKLRKTKSNLKINGFTKEMDFDDSFVKKEMEEA